MIFAPVKSFAPSKVLRVVRADAEAVVLESVNDWSRYYGTAAALSVLALVVGVGPFIPIGGRSWVPYVDELSVPFLFACGFYVYYVYQLRFGDSPTYARVRFAGGGVELVSPGREGRTRRIDLATTRRWYVLTKGQQITWKRQPGGAVALTLDAYPLARVDDVIRAALATVGRGDVAVTTLDSGRLYTWTADAAKGLAPAPGGETWTTASDPATEQGARGASPLSAAVTAALFDPRWPAAPIHRGTDHTTGGTYLTARRVGDKWIVRSPRIGEVDGNTLTVNLRERWVRSADHPRLRGVGHFEHLAFFRAEDREFLPERGGSASMGVVIRLFFRKHYPLDIFRLVGSPSDHPEFDGQPLREEAEAVCAWLNALLREAREAEAEV